MSGREPSEMHGDSYATTALELLQLLTQTKAALKFFRVFKGFTADPGRKYRSKDRTVTLRVHWNAADSARGVFGVQDLHEDLVQLSRMLHQIYLAILDIEVAEWYPSVTDLQNHYIDLELEKFGVGRVLLHKQRGPVVQNVFELQAKQGL